MSKTLNLIVSEIKEEHTAEIIDEIADMEIMGDTGDMHDFEQVKYEIIRYFILTQISEKKGKKLLKQYQYLNSKQGEKK